MDMIWRDGKVIYRTPRGGYEILLDINGQFWSVCPYCQERAQRHPRLPPNELNKYRAVCPRKEFERIGVIE